MTLDGLFSRLRELQSETLSGKDSEGEWTMRRYEIELRSTSDGRWSAVIKDWTLINERFGMAIASNADPSIALANAMQQAGIRLTGPMTEIV